MKKKIGIIVVLVILVLIAVLVKCCFFSETRSEELEKIKQDIESRYEDDIDRLNYANELIKQRNNYRWRTWDDVWRYNGQLYV